MSTNGRDIYLLNRDAVETKRLREQHEHAVDIFGYVVHPVVKNGLPLSARIADIGTGSGIWLLDAARSVSEEAQLFGFDISDQQFPLHPPTNVKFELADMKESFRQDMLGTFDLVHVRAVVFAMQAWDWATVTSNLVQLLKPGGFLQWTEGDMTRLRCLRGPAAYQQYTSIPRLLDIWEKNSADRTADVWKNRARAIEQQNLENVLYDTVSTDRNPATRADLARNYTTFILGWAAKVDAVSPEEINALERGVEEDIKNGAYIRVDGITIVGQKSEGNRLVPA